MPFDITKDGSKYKVITEGTNKVHGTFSSRRKALAQLRALYARVPEASNGKVDAMKRRML